MREDEGRGRKRGNEIGRRSKKLEGRRNAETTNSHVFCRVASLFLSVLHASHPFAAAACSTLAHFCTSVPSPSGPSGISSFGPFQNGARSSFALGFGMWKGWASVVKTQSSKDRREGGENSR